MTSPGPRLRDRVVVVTRSAEDGSKLAALFEAEGAEVLLVPTIEIRAVNSTSEINATLASAPSFDGIVLGSQHAAEQLFEAAERSGASLASARFFVVGEKTRSFVRERMPAASVECPSIYRAEALAALIRDRFDDDLHGRRFLYPRAAEGREILQDALRRAGAHVEALTLYHIETATPPGPDMLSRLEDADVLSFLSGRTLENWLRILPEATARRHLERARVAVIGPVALATAQRLGIRVDILPEEATQEGLVEAVASALQGEP